MPAGVFNVRNARSADGVKPKSAVLPADRARLRRVDLAFRRGDLLACIIFRELACRFDLNFDFDYTLAVYAQVRHRARDSECR
jgi:hypothetical protein